MISVVAASLNTLGRLAPQFGDEAITAGHLQRVKERAKALRAAEREGDFRRSPVFQNWKRNRAQVLQRVAAAARAGEEQLAVASAAAGGQGVEVILPRYSQVARDRSDRGGGPLPGERDRIPSEPRLTDERVDELLAIDGFRFQPRLVEADEPFDQAFIDAELARVAIVRKTREGRCLEPGCERLQTLAVVQDEDDAKCGPCWWASNSQDFDDVEEEVRLRLRADLEVD